MKAMKAFYSEQTGYVISYADSFSLDVPFVEITDIESVLLSLKAGKVAKVQDGAIVFEIDRASIMAKIRTERELLLQDADAFRNRIYDQALISGTEPDPETLKSIAIYRQQLRDIVETVDIENIVWPQKPWLTV